jgi:hypothetical protein
MNYHVKNYRLCYWKYYPLLHKHYFFKLRSFSYYVVIIYNAGLEATIQRKWVSYLINKLEFVFEYEMGFFFIVNMDIRTSLYKSRSSGSFSSSFRGWVNLDPIRMSLAYIARLGPTHIFYNIFNYNNIYYNIIKKNSKNL